MTTFVMTSEDEVLLRTYQRFLDHFNNDVPSMEHEPIRFAYYVKMFQYYEERKNVEANSAAAADSMHNVQH